MSNVPPPPAGSSPTPPESTPMAPGGKRTTGGLIKRIVMVLFVLVVAGLVVLYLSRNSLVRAGVVMGGEAATGLHTELESANLAVMAGVLDLNVLNMDNVKGFKEPKLATLKGVTIKVSPASLLSDTVQVEELAINGLEITLEQDGVKNNLNELIQTLRQKSPAAGETTEQPSGKNLRIQTLTLGGTKVHVRAAPMPPMTLDLGPITMKDPTNPDGRAMKIADVVAKVLLNVTQQAMNDPKLPGNIKDAMKNVTAVLDNLKELDALKALGKSPEELSRAMQDAGKKAQQDIQKGLQDVGKGIQDATRGIQDIFRREN